MRKIWITVCFCLAWSGQARAGFFATDHRLRADVWVPPYGLQLGGEYGAAWQFWGEDPRLVLPPAGMVLGAPWKFGFARAVLDASSNGASNHLGATAHLEPIGILQLKAGAARDLRTVPVEGEYAHGLDSVGQLQRQSVEALVVPLPWPYGYAAYDALWERVTHSGDQPGGFIEASSGLVGRAGGDILSTQTCYLIWIPKSSLNFTFFASWQNFQGSGDSGNLQGVKIDWPRGKYLPSLILGRWETTHTKLPAFLLLSLAWVGQRALDR